MKILLTGATGYIGKRLLPILLDDGHSIICCVRDSTRFQWPPEGKERVEVLEIDFLDENSRDALPQGLDVAFYLIHSMSGDSHSFDEKEARTALHFRDAASRSGVTQVIYLSGIVNEDQLSKHLASRKQVEAILQGGSYHLTTLRAGIIVGSGSASFEIIRDLVEKLPVMIAPKWLNTRCQPIAIRDVLSFLQRSVGREDVYDQDFDIGGPDILTYREMLLRFARVRKLKRFIWTVPVMTPKLSSYWLYFVTSTSYPLAIALVDSMKVEVVCRDQRLAEILGIRPIPYEEAVERAFMKIEQNHVLSSWKDSMISGRLGSELSAHIEVPTFGCLSDVRKFPVQDEDETVRKIFSLGGETGWYYGNSLWRIRGFLDKLVGGVGLRRGRTHPTEIHSGDALDFWRVLYANRDEKRLLLYAEMIVPGEAWLEFRVKNGQLSQTATFRPKGVWGRMYWYALTPLHEIVFRTMAKRLAA